MSDFNIGKPPKGKLGGKSKSNKSIIVFAVAIVLLAAIGYWAFAGFHVNLRHFVPWWSEVQLGLDLRGGVYATYEIQDEKVDQEKLNELTTVMQNRLFAQGYNEAAVTVIGEDRVRVEIPNVDDPNAVADLIGSPGKLEFRDPNGNVVITGENVKSANAVSGSSPSVDFELDSKGAELFAKATQANIGKSISIYLDGEIQDSPTVQSAIVGGRGQITVNTYEDAERIETYIKSGSLPVNIKELDMRNTSATLGADALKGALMAAAIGFACIFIFMLVFYRLMGLVANMALIAYVYLVLWIHAFFPWGVQLTLPGILGLVLGIGMAVDANVIVFERIKDEYRIGKSLRSAVDTGFNRAFVAVWDGSVTTIITAVILWIFGTVEIRGFAVSLGISIICSLLTSVSLTKFLLKNMVNFRIKNMKLYNLKREAKVNEEAITDR